jgi:hypothetical protein
MNFKNLIITGLAALAMTSCSKNEEVVNEVENGEEAVVSFKLSCDDILNTKATGRHILYSLNDNNVKPAKDNGEIEEVLKTNKSYTFNFWWAENGDSANFDGICTTDLISEDLFCGTETFAITSSKEISVKLTRPYAKIRITASEESVITDSTKIEIEGLGTRYNISTGKVVDFGTISKTCKFENGVVAEVFGFVDSSIGNVTVKFTINGKTTEKIVNVRKNLITTLAISNVESCSPTIKVTCNKNWDIGDDIILDDYIEISNLEELKDFRDAVNTGVNYDGKTIKLTADIDLENEYWEPIGNDYYFLGSFDGQGHTIKNLNTGDEKLSHIGFFGKLQGSVSDLIIENATIKGGYYVGVLAGYSSSSSYFKNITIKGDIKIKGYNNYIGGFFGRTSRAIFKNLILDANSGSYIEANSRSYYIGGFSGWLSNWSSNLKDDLIKIKNIEIKNNYFHTGGFVGYIGEYNVDCYIYNCELENVIVNLNSPYTGKFIGYYYNYNNYYFYNCKITENGETRSINADDFRNSKYSEDGGQLFFYDYF